jgi:hypothetical protein
MRLKSPSQKKEVIMLRFIQCIFFLAFLIIASGVTYSQEMMPLQKSPIDLVDDRAPSGKPFTFTITLPKEKQNEKVWFTVYFTAGKDTIETSAHVDKEEAKGNEVIYTVKAIVPKYEEIFKKVNKRWWHEGWWSARQARVNISAGVAQDTYENSFPFAIPLRKTATFWGVLVVVILLVIIALMKPNPFPTDTRFDDGKGDKRAKEWKEQHPSWISRLLLYPLHFAITPIGTYSISVAQIVFWTAIVIFASIYVFFIRSEFLHVSEQVLTLLGISGGTALFAKANAVVRSREIPAEFFKGIQRTRIPRLRDLICIGGSPNIFKFQILAFTLINGIFVLKQLYTDFDFPVIPDGQLILMGISSGVYLGNEIAWENIWNTMKKKLDEAKDASDRGDTEASTALKDEIPKLLKSIYSTT